MPVRFQSGGQLKTGTNTVLHGASTAGVSFWLRYNAAAQTSSNFDVFIKQFEILLNCSRLLNQTTKTRLQLSGVNGAFTVDFTPTLTVAYHILLVWTAGAQSCYVNGALQGSATTAGALSNPGALLFSLGGAATACDISMDDPAVWVGYAPTAQDALDLRDRVKTPSQVNSASLVWGLTLDGTAGVTVALNDAGLTDYSASGLNITTITGTGAPAYFPAYDGNPLNYSPPTVVKRATVAPSGLGVSFEFCDALGAAQNVTALTTNPTISVNGGAPITLGNALWGIAGTTAQPWMYFPLAFPVLATDSVTWSAAAGWVTTAAGASGAASNLPLTNLVSGSLLPVFVPGKKAMPAGTNLVVISYFGPVSFPYGNVFLQSDGWLGDGKTSGVTPALDANGNLTGFSGGSNTAAIISKSDTAPGGYPGLPPGTYTLVYDGTAPAQLDGFGTNTVTQLTGNFTGTVNNTYTYNVVRVPGGYNLQLALRALGPGTITNVRVWPPGVAPGTKYHPYFTNMLTGMRLLRPMGTMSTNASTIGSISDYPPAGYANYGGARTKPGIAISTVGPYTTGTWGATNSNCLATTASPHGLSSGQTISFPSTAPAITLTSGSVGVASLKTSVVVLSPTTFTFGVFQSGNLQPVSQSYPVTVTCNPPGGMPLVDICELTNKIPGCDLWFNVPAGLPDADVTSVFALLAVNLAADRNLWAEWSNEPWNFGGAFTQAGYCYAQAQLDSSLTLTTFDRMKQWIAKRSSQVQDLAAAAWASAGRPAGQIKRVLSSQWASTTWADVGLSWAASNGKSFDAVCVAPYFDGVPASWAGKSYLNTITDTLVVGQVHDLSQLWLLYGYQANLQSQLAMIASHAAQFPGLKLAVYEGGPQAGMVGGANAATLSLQWGRHHRLRDAYLYVLQLFNDSGCLCWNHFNIGQGPGAQYVTNDANWGTYLRWDALPGVGDGSDARTNNEANYSNLGGLYPSTLTNGLVSVAGHAVDVWNGVADPGLAVLPALPGPRRVLDVLRFP